MQCSQKQRPTTDRRRSRKGFKEDTMLNRYLAMMGAAALAASVFGSGCSRNPTANELGSATITAKNFLQYSEITKVEVTVSGANITKPILVPLGQKSNSNDWATTVQGI